jgi:hypothetical protein
MLNAFAAAELIAALPLRLFTVTGGVRRADTIPLRD